MGIKSNKSNTEAIERAASSSQDQHASKNTSYNETNSRRTSLDFQWLRKVVYMEMKHPVIPPVHFDDVEGRNIYQVTLTVKDKSDHH